MMLSTNTKKNTKTRNRAVDGVLLVYKEAGMTSHDVINRLRKITSQRRIGHVGTLDPLADGLLVTCFGETTKIARYLTDLHKSYRATVRLGATSETYDREGIVDEVPTTEVTGVTEEDIERALEEFRGDIQQRVPAYSAVRVGGKRLYESSRQGKNVDAPFRPVTIYGLTIVSFDNPDVVLDVSCSKGTYIRSLAHDMGQELGCGGYLRALTRTAVGELSLSRALTLTEVEEKWQTGELHEALRAAEEVLPLKAIVVNDRGRERVVHGADVSGEAVERVDAAIEKGDTIIVKDRQGTALAVGIASISAAEMRAEGSNTVFSYARVLT